LGLKFLPKTTKMSSAEVCSLRRLYSTFAGGWPGIGLILIRFVVGLVLVGSAVSTVLADPPIATAVVPVLLAGAGILLMVGLYTPIVGTLVALTEICGVFTAPAQRLVYLLIATFGAALAMLGPGVWSVDARLFGWRRIEPSPRKR
jgi:putative oxidoreductase